MNSHEEELQRKAEHDQAPSGDKDVEVYRRVFRSLQREPGFKLSPRFAETVAARITTQRQSLNTPDYLWFGAGITFLLGALIATILFTGFKLNFGFLNVMSDYKGLAIFGAAFLVFLHWLDKRIVRQKFAEP